MVEAKNIAEFLQEVKKSKRLGHLKKHPQYDMVVQLTSFLPSTSSVSRRVWHIHNGPYIPKCKECNNDAPWEKTKGGFYRTFCSSKCSHANVDVRSQTATTNKERYGHPTAMLNPEIKQRIVDNWTQKYGVDNPAKSIEVKKKIRSSHIKLKNKHISNKESIVEMITNGLTQKEIGQQLGICQPRVSNLLNILDLSTQTNCFSSAVQREVEQFVSSIYSNSIIINDACTIRPHHLDILIPHKKVAIEINGIYWHSEISGKLKSYHQHKMLACKQQGINLIQIWDTEWNNKQDIVQSRIAAKLGLLNKLHGRLCSVVKLTTSEADHFITEHHIQGARHANICFGLTYNKELVAVMTFLRDKKDGEYELLRYCSKQLLNVVGGAGKLLSHFIKTYNPDRIISFADNRWNTGGVYQALGFTFIENTRPNYWYFHRAGDSSKLMSRLQFQKHKLVNKLDTYNEKLTEWENMKLNGFDRVWDCGSSKWEWKKGG